MKKSSFNIFLIFLCLFWSSINFYASAQGEYPEKIYSYHTDVEISKDFSMLITETFAINCAGVLLNRGPLRDLSKSITDPLGNTLTINPEVVVVFRDNAPDGFMTKDLGAGIRVFIGKGNYILPVGKYTYTLIYKVTNPLIVHENSYQLYWDVTGKRWPFPILKASVTFKLPYGSNERIMNQVAYLDNKPIGADKVKITRSDRGHATYELKQPLNVGERFSATIVWQKKPQPVKKEPPKNLKKLVSLSSNNLRLGKNALVKNIIDIPLNEPVNINFLEREEIYEIREKYVNQHHDLLEKDYLPYAPVWRFISNKKPWWSIKGAYCYGYGNGSIIGETDATRYIANPFLLLAVDDAFSLAMKRRSFIPVYPRPKSLRWDALYAQAVAVYDMSRYFEERGHMPFDIRNTFYTLVNFNARDFGYKFIFCPLEKCRGITPHGQATLFEEPTKLKNILIDGKSCQYPGGCNEVAPVQPELYYQVSFDSESILYCKLWKQKPKDVQQQADFIYIIKFE